MVIESTRICQLLWMFIVLHYLVLSFIDYGSTSTLFPAMNPNSMAAMQSALLSGFCSQPPAEAMRGMSGNGARSPTNVSENSDNCEPSSPEMSLSLHPALPGQVSFDETTQYMLRDCHVLIRASAYAYLGNPFYVPARVTGLQQLLCHSSCQFSCHMAEPV